LQSRLASYLPILGWLRTYDLTMLTDDALAAIIVTIMLVP
jgi:SulP family sulfate permease